MTARTSHPVSYPGIPVAVALTVVAWLTMLAWREATRPWFEPRMASLVGLWIGPGLVGLIALTRVEPPRWARVLGRAVEPRFVPPIILLVPAIVPVLQLHGWIRRALGTPPVAGAFEWSPGLVPPESASGLLATFVIAVLLMPVVFEWFFRGLLYQGIAARHGASLAVVVSALLAALFHTGQRGSAGEAVAVAVAAFVWAAILGSARAVSGSIVPPLLLHTGNNLVWFLMIGASRGTPVPGLTSAGTQLPGWLLVPSLVSVLAGVGWLAREARRRPTPGS